MRERNKAALLLLSLSKPVQGHKVSRSSELNMRTPENALQAVRILDRLKRSGMVGGEIGGRFF